VTSWTGTASAWWWLVLAGCDLLIAVVLLVEGQPTVGLPMLIAAVALSMFTEVRVTVDERGLRARTGWLPWPSITVPLASIEAAAAIDVRPWRWGGWGYRGSLRVFRRAAWVVRAGPGIEVTLTGGRRFAVTVDDADAGVAALRARLTPPG
jgi:hypothetical protein